MNKNLIYVVIAVVILAAGAWYFAQSSQPAVTGPAADNTFGTYNYECDERVTFMMRPASDMSVIQVAATGNGAYPPVSTLVKKEAASGVRYEGNGVVFTARGETVTLGEGDSAINCSPVPSQDEAPFNFGD